MEVRIDVKVYDKDGRLIEHKNTPIKSWLKNAAALFNSFFNNASARATAVSGQSISIPTSSGIGSVFSVMAGSGNDSYGILIGSGSAAVTADDYKLASQIPNSTVSYSAVSLSNGLNKTTGGYQFSVSRSFTNNSSSAVNVSEIGLAVYGSGSYVLLIRDVLNSAIALQPQNTMTVTYIFTFNA